MYRGFNLTLENTGTIANYPDISNSILFESKEIIKQNLISFIKNDGKIDGTKMQNDWFPEINADVFISHSHKDELLAKKFASYLKDKFNLTSFIDSCVWGYANDLLKEIDNKYCIMENGTLYDYDKRNYSTSHVHMMLSTALAMMLDKTECVFLLNTGNSIKTSSLIQSTESPWLYSEITYSKLLRRREPVRDKSEIYKSLKSVRNFSENAQFEYEVDLSHLSVISENDINTWAVSCNLSKHFNTLIYKSEEKHPLDIFYKQIELPKTNQLND